MQKRWSTADHATLLAISIQHIEEMAHMKWKKWANEIDRVLPKENYTIPGGKWVNECVRKRERRRDERVTLQIDAFANQIIYFLSHTIALSATLYAYCIRVPMYRVFEATILLWRSKKKEKKWWRVLLLRFCMALKTTATLLSTRHTSIRVEKMQRLQRNGRVASYEKKRDKKTTTSEWVKHNIK